MTPFERALAERMQAEAAGIQLPPRERWVPSDAEHPSSSRWIGASIVLGVVIATVAVLGGEVVAPSGRALAPPPLLVRPQPTGVPVGWNVFVEGGLLLAIPPEFGSPRAQRVPTFGGPNAPTLLTMLDFERGLSVLVWKGTVRQLLDEQWGGGVRPPDTRVRVGVLPSGEEVVQVSEGQRDPGGGPSGTDEHRNVFWQLTPDQVAHIALGPTTAAAPGTASKISAAQRVVQDRIAASLRAASDVDATIDRAHVEAILRRVVRQLENADVPAGSPELAKIYAGEQWVYNWPNSSQSFAYIVVYPDRAARERDSQPRALVQWRSPVTQRGVGNVLVLVGSNDANLRYHVLAELDALKR